jgi:hypothetical protein
LDRTIKFTSLALIAAIALFAMMALSASADPVSVANPPTEDWIFNESKNTTISDETWKVRYNITVTNDSTLKIDTCTWTFNGTDPWNPIWIFVDFNCTLEIESSMFKADEGAPGFYIESHGETKFNDVEFVGLAAHPRDDAGLVFYGANVTMTFVKIYDTNNADALYFENCNVSIANTKIHDIPGDGIINYHENTEFNVSYTFTIIDSEIWNIEHYAMLMWNYKNYGNLYLICDNVKVHDVDDYGFIVAAGSQSYSDRGNGSVYAVLDHMEIYNMSSKALWFDNQYQRAGSLPSQNWFNVTLINSTLRNITNTGIYHQHISSATTHNLIVENVLFEEISLEPTGDRVGGIFLWRTGGSNTVNLYVGNSSFKKCSPGALTVWDESGVKVHFYGTEFTECTDDAVYIEMRRTSMGSHFFENCSFYDNPGYGVRFYSSYASTANAASPIIVVNSTFQRNGQTALHASTYSYNYNRNVGFNVTGCLIEDHQGNAIDISSGYAQGPIILILRDTRINNTGGVRMMLDRGYPNAAVGINVDFINASIENCTSNAMSFMSDSYSSSRISLNMHNSTISQAAGDAITLSIRRTSSSYKGNWDAYIDVQNSTLDTIGGVGFSLAVEDLTLTGKRYLIMNNTKIYSTQRGIFALGFKCDVRYSDFKDTLKEDAIAIGSVIELWYCKFAQIADRKFKALEGGEIDFYYDFQIYVKWDTGAPALGATVQIMDNTQKLIGVWPVERDDGGLPLFTMNPYFVRDTGIFSTTPYIINATFLQVSKTVGVKLNYKTELTIILEDHFEPEIFILYPKEGHIQQSTTLQVRGSAWDSQSGIKEVLVSLDGIHWENAFGALRWNYTFEVNESLIGRFAGVFNLRAKAIDYAANEKLAFVLIRIDPTPPELNVDFPYNGYVTNNPELWVRGVTELGSTVEINSVPVDITVSMFTHKVNLVEGPNSISVISIDPLGNIQIERMTVHLDTQEPYVILVSPEEKAMTNNATLLVEAQLEEELEITINGYAVPYDSEWYVKDTGVLSYPVELEPGENIIVIQARDEADNLLVIDRVVTFDTSPPWIQVISPTNEEVLPRPEVTVVGTVDPTVTLLVNDEDVTIQNGYFERVILALEGRNVIELKAIDAAGNEYVEQLVIHIDTEAPRVMITAPEETEVMVNAPRYYINGTVKFDNVITAERVLLNGLDHTLIDDGTGQLVRTPIDLDANGDFSIPVDLLEGKNEFTVEVQDAVGNKATASTMVRLDTHAPTLVMYIDPVIRTEEGMWESPSLVVNITGYTDPGSVLTINRIQRVPVDENGRFVVSFDLNPKGVTEITIRSVDTADNIREIQQEVEFIVSDGGQDKETNWGLWFLVASVLVLIVVGIVTAILVQKNREELLEMDAYEPQLLEPMDEMDTLPGPEEISLEDEAEPAPTTAPARPRPPQVRRAGVPTPIVEEEPDMEEKDLSEKDAEEEISADEIDQEGI